MSLAAAPTRKGDAVWTLAEMERLLAAWIVKVRQNRKPGQYAPAWDPGGRHRPDTLFAAAAANNGISLEIPGPGLYYQLLPAHLVKIDRRRGVEAGGLWYGGTDPVLDPCRGQRFARGGRHEGKRASAVIPGTAARSTSKTPGTLGTGTLCAGTACRPGTTSGPSATRVCARSCARRAAPGSRRATTANCCLCCWSRWPRGRRCRTGRPR
jgi:hypothetical protein